MNRLAMLYVDGIAMAGTVDDLRINGRPLMKNRGVGPSWSSVTVPRAPDGPRLRVPSYSIEAMHGAMYDHETELQRRYLVGSLQEAMKRHA